MPQNRPFPLSRGVQTGITNHHRLVGLPRDTKDGNKDYKQQGRSPFTHFRQSSSILFHTLQTSSKRKQTHVKISLPLNTHDPKPRAGPAKQTSHPSLFGRVLLTYKRKSPLRAQGSGLNHHLLLQDPSPASETEGLRLYLARRNSERKKPTQDIHR